MSTTLSELNKFWDEIISKAQAMKQQINTEMEQKLSDITTEQQKLETLKQKIQTVSPLVKEIVKLNVGGKKFATSKQNLLSEPSFFTGLLSNHFSVERDEKGAIFIDRNPKYFSIILDYLRNQQINLKQLTDDQKEEFLKEVKFYEIHSLLQKLCPNQGQDNPLQFDPEYVTPRVTLSNHNTKVTVANGNEWNCAILCNKQAKRWKIIIGSSQRLFESGGLMIGVGSKGELKKEGNNYQKSGYYVNANGYLYGVGKSQVTYGSKFGNGSTIEVLYENGNLSFIIDGTNYGIAYSNLPNNLYPAFEFHFGCTLTIQQLE